jgi:hypothetical protein
METAKKELISLIDALLIDELIPSSGSEGTGGTVEVTNQGHVFRSINSDSDEVVTPSDHDRFFRRHHRY